MRLLTAAAFTLIAATAWAQTPLTGTTGPLANAPAIVTPAAPAPGRHRATLAERFSEANTTHDGHLTLEQARSKLPFVAHHFDAIDTGKQGYVTLDQIRGYQRAQGAERRAARKAAAPQ